MLKKILQLKTTGLQLLVLITFHICAFHTTKPTALSKVNIVHFLYKILSPTLHNIILLQTKYSKNLFCPLYVIYVTQKQNLQTNHLPYYIDNKMCFYLVIFVYCSSHLYPEWTAETQSTIFGLFNMFYLRYKPNKTFSSCVRP